MKYLRRRLSHQLLFLCTAVALSYGLGWYWDFHPRLRFSADMLLRGTAAGALCFFAILLLHGAAAMLLPSYQERLLEDARRLRAASLFAAAGSAIAAGAGEELLFRGIIFTKLASFGLFIAFPLHFALMAMVYLERRRGLPATFIKAVECTFYAALFQLYQGLTPVAAAHMLVEGAFMLLLRSKIGISFLESLPLRALVSRRGLRIPAAYRNV